MASDDGFHFVPCIIHVWFKLVVPMVEEDGEKGGKGGGSVRAVTVLGTTSLSRTCVTKH